MRMLLALLALAAYADSSSLRNDIERAVGTYDSSRMGFTNAAPLCQFETIRDDASADACMRDDIRCVTPIGMCAVNIASCRYVKLQNGACMKATA